MINKYGLFSISENALSRDEYNKIKERMTNNTKFSKGSKFPDQKISVFWQYKDIILLPRQYALNELKYVPSKIMLSNGDNLIDNLKMNTKITLFNHQNEAIDACKREYDSGRFGGIVKIACGKGKTFTMLALIKTIGKKALVIVDKVSLADDWLKESKYFFGDKVRSTILNSTVSKGNSSSIISSNDICIIVLRGAYLGKFKPDEYIPFGLVIIDEVHNTIGQKVCNLFRYISRRFIVGISGTPTRADHLEYMLGWYIGPIIYEGQIHYTGAPPIVHKYVYKSKDPKFAKIITKSDGKSVDPTATYKNTMVFDPERRIFLGKLIKHYKNYYPQILVIGILRDQLEGLMLDLIDNKNISFGDVGIYYGGVVGIENDVIKKKPIILGMRKMCAESLNIPELRCVILASSYKPANDGLNVEKFEQQIHRIMRKDHKEPPVIVDIKDDYGFFIKHSVLRDKYYKEHGYHVVSIN